MLYFTDTFSAGLGVCVIKSISNVSLVPLLGATIRKLINLGKASLAFLTSESFTISKFELV